ncbi:hypothetical protein [Dendrosporobacter quercicolus]
MKMSVMVAAQLKAGIIFGDTINHEYIYMPGGEVGVDNPICVMETAHSRQDIELKRAVELILRLSLKPARHPRFGRKSC